MVPFIIIESRVCIWPELALWLPNKMIGQNKEQMNTDGASAKTALRDAFIIFLITLLSQLSTAGFPPNIEVVYNALIAGGLTAVISYAYAVGVKRQQPSTQ